MKFPSRPGSLGGFSIVEPNESQMIEVPIETLKKQRLHMMQILDMSKSYQLVIFLINIFHLKKNVTNPHIPDS